MALMDAPVYDPTSDRRKRNVAIGVTVTFVLLVVLTLAGYVMGHGWLFTNVPYEHTVNKFFDAVEAKDYVKAYGLWQGDPEWQSHPDKYVKDYTLQRFTEDWTTESPVKGPITSHVVDISRTDGTGTLGSAVTVAVRLNGGKPIFMSINKTDKSLRWPAYHELCYKYHPCE